MQTSSPRSLFLSFAALALAALAGCATQGPAFVNSASAPADKALIYIYRNAAFGGAALTPRITIDNDTTFALTLGGYYPYVATPGPVLVRITDIGTRTTTIDAKAGKTYYLRGGLIFMAAGFPSLGQLNAAEALPELQACNRIGDDKVTHLTAAVAAAAAASATH